MSNVYLSGSRSASNVYKSFPGVPTSFRIRRYITGAYIIRRSRSTPKCLYIWIHNTRIKRYITYSYITSGPRNTSNVYISGKQVRPVLKSPKCSYILPADNRTDLRKLFLGSSSSTLTYFALNYLQGADGIPKIAETSLAQED